MSSIPRRTQWCRRNLPIQLCVCLLLNFPPTDFNHFQYVSTASNVLANTFGVSLNVALALAFCQYLWRVVRLSTLKISTIEALFSLRSNPLLLFRGDAIKAAPPLFLIAILMWSIQIAISFPTGALTVVSANRTTFSMLSVPTFNGSFVRTSCKSAPQLSTDEAP
jgi:hypothetical protein